MSFAQGRGHRFCRDLGGGAELVWLEDDDELDRASAITEADKARAAEAWRRDARPAFRGLLGAEPAPQPTIG